MCNCERSSENLDFTELDTYLDTLPTTRGMTIGMLQKVQAIYGYLPREAIAHLAAHTGMSESKLYGVATFYAQFRMVPTGRHLIMLCQGTACHVNGADTIERAICDELNIQNGGTTEDRVFTLQTVACLGCCSLAPVMMIDGETYANLTPEKTVQILHNLRKEA